MLAKLSVVQSFSRNYSVLLESVNKVVCTVPVTVDYDSMTFVLSKPDF